MALARLTVIQKRIQYAEALINGEVTSFEDPLDLGDLPEIQHTRKRPINTRSFSSDPGENDAMSAFLKGM